MTTVCVDPDDFQTDGAGRLQIKTACGIANSEDGLIADVTEWPFDCDQSSGEDVYCDGSTGKLIVRPRPHLDCISVSAFDETDTTVLNNGDTRILTAESTIDATQWCGTDSVAVVVQIGGSWSIGVDQGGGWRIDIQESLDGAAFTNVFFGAAGRSQSTEEEPATTHQEFGHFYGPRSFNITPNAVFSYRVRIKITSLDPVDITVFSLGARITGTFQTANP